MTYSFRGVAALLISLASSVCFGANVRLDGNTIVVNEVPVIAFRAENGEHRAQTVAGQLHTLTGNQSVSVRQDKGNYVVKIGDVVIDGIWAEAVIRSTSSQRLAHQWAARLSYAFGLPPLRLESTSLELGVGAVASIKMVGSQVPQAQIRVTDSSVLSAKRTDSGLSISALKVGHTQVSITSGASNELVDVDVKALAAVFPQVVDVSVSGAPANVATVKGVVQGALQTRVVTAEGANLVYKLPAVSDVAPGSTQVFTVRARVSAPDALQSAGDVRVVVHNLGLPQEKDEQLWYSNDPESVVRPGAIFSSTLKLGSPVRLLYHHVNASNQGLYLRVQAINDSDSVAKVLIIPGDSKPDRNPVRAGLKAADQYLRAWMFGSGEVVTIPAHETLPISLRRLLPGETMSGLCSLRLLSGPKELQVRTDSWPLFQIDSRWEAAVWSSTPWRWVGTSPINDYDRAPYEPSQHIFPSPYRDDLVTYRVGDRFGVCRLGQKPLSSQDDQQRLDGNFGVIYRIHASISNPTTIPTDVEVVFEASAGYSGALFIVNGDYVSTPILQPKDEARVGRFHLNPGASQSFLITTLPLSGGSYPATITLRPVASAAHS